MPEIRASCSTYAEDLSALLDGELSAERETEVRAHLDSCGPCAKRLDALRRVDELLAGAPIPDVPATVHARLDARIAEDRAAPTPGPAHRRWRGGTGLARWFSRPALGVVAAAAAAVALYLAVTPGGAPLSELADLDAASEEELAVVIELETIEDLDVIANLEFVERLVALEEGTG